MLASLSQQLAGSLVPHARWRGGGMRERMRTYDYTELDAWKRAIDLAVAVYSFSSAFPLEERYGLTGQSRRAAVSVAANIAEGQRRSTDGEFLNQLSVANGSLGELETHVVIAERLGLVTRGEAKGILDRAAEVGRLVNGLSRSIRARIEQRGASSRRRLSDH